MGAESKGINSRAPMCEDCGCPIYMEEFEPFADCRCASYEWTDNHYRHMQSRVFSIINYITGDDFIYYGNALVSAMLMRSIPAHPIKDSVVLFDMSGPSYGVYNANSENGPSCWPTDKHEHTFLRQKRFWGIMHHICNNKGNERGLLFKRIMQKTWN